jgi:hypothetical protein
MQVRKKEKKTHLKVGRLQNKEFRCRANNAAETKSNIKHHKNKKKLL